MAERSAKQTQISYMLLAPVGSGRAAKIGRILALLSDIPYFFVSRIVPPLSVVNEVLKKGVVNAGMSGGCRWKPFQMTPEQYGDLVREMKRKRFKEIKPPDWVASHADWYLWCCELVWGIPAIKGKQFSDDIAELERQRHEALKNSDDIEAARLLSRITDVAIESSTFINSHRLSKPRLPIFRR